MFQCSPKKKATILKKEHFLQRSQEGGTQASAGSLGFLHLMTTTSRMPSGRNLGENRRGSTGPGRLKENVNDPGEYIF